MIRLHNFYLTSLLPFSVPFLQPSMEVQGAGHNSFNSFFFSCSFLKLATYHKADAFAMRESKPRTCLIQNWSKQTKICNHLFTWDPCRTRHMQKPMLMLFVYYVGLCFSYVSHTRSSSKIIARDLHIGWALPKVYICKECRRFSPSLSTCAFSLSAHFTGYGMLMISNRETWLQDTKNISLFVRLSSKYAITLHTHPHHCLFQRVTHLNELSTEMSFNL